MPGTNRLPASANVGVGQSQPDRVAWSGRLDRRWPKSLGHAVREGSRKSSFPFDWDQPETWPATLKGAQSATISYSPNLAFPGAPEKIEALTRYAIEPTS